jgi:anti-anti-sigma factor
MTTLQAKLIRNEGHGIWVLEFAATPDQRNFQLASVKDLTPVLEYLLQLQAHKLTIDLAATERLDSQALQLLLVMQRQFSKEKIQVVLRNPSVHLRRLLRVMQFDRVFEIEEDNRSGTATIIFGPPVIRSNGI